MIKLYNDDCLSVLPTLPDSSVNMIFADPPFNVGLAYGGTSANDRRDDYYEWCAQWIAESFRVLADTGTFYLMTIGRHVYQMGHEMGKHGTFVNKIEWHNVSAACDGKSFWPSTQTIWMFGKSDKRTFNKLAQTRTVAMSWNADRQMNTKGHLGDYWNDIPFVYAGSIRHPEAIMMPGTNRKAHPAQMPVALAARTILFSTNDGDTVLDPFMGTGTVGVACSKNNRDFIGIEKNESYFAIANNRIAESQSQLTLL